MDNQHEKIKSYNDLTQEQIDAINLDKRLVATMQQRFDDHKARCEEQLASLIKKHRLVSRTTNGDDTPIAAVGNEISRVQQALDDLKEARKLVDFAGILSVRSITQPSVEHIMPFDLDALINGAADSDL